MDIFKIEVDGYTSNQFIQVYFTCFDIYFKIMNFANNFLPMAFNYEDIFKVIIINRQLMYELRLYFEIFINISLISPFY